MLIDLFLTFAKIGMFTFGGGYAMIALIEKTWFLEIALIANAFKGIKIAVGILIIDAALKMLKKMEKKPFQICMVVSSAVAMLLISFFSLGISSMVLMLTAA